MSPVRELTRRELLGGFVGLVLLPDWLPAGNAQPGPSLLQRSRRPRPLDPHRWATRTLKLRAQPIEHDLGGRVVSTWGYGGSVPGPVLRANVRRPSQDRVHQ